MWNAKLINVQVSQDQLTVRIISPPARRFIEEFWNFGWFAQTTAERIGKRLKKLRGRHNADCISDKRDWRPRGKDNRKIVISVGRELRVLSGPIGTKGEAAVSQRRCGLWIIQNLLQKLMKLVARLERRQAIARASTKENHRLVYARDLARLAITGSTRRTKFISFDPRISD